MMMMTNSEKVRIWKESAVEFSRYYPSFHLESLRKTIKPSGWPVVQLRLNTRTFLSMKLTPHLLLVQRLKCGVLNLSSVSGA
jgi:hypothetical protein